MSAMSGSTAPPLAGLRVLDATDELGVYATKLLADLGAEVIRLEPPAGDPMRAFPPFAPGDPPLSLFHEHYNAGKRSVTLDFDDPGAPAALRALVGSCHALVESGRPRDLLSVWLGEGWTRDARPDLVLVSVTPFGREGPYAGDAATDLILAARSGLLWLTGDPAGPPHRPGGEQTGHVAGLQAANAALLGLLQQGRNGKGVHVDVVAAFAALMTTLQTANANYTTWHGRVPARRGMGPAFARHLYPAADGWVTLTPLPGQWDNLVRLLHDHESAADLGDDAYQDATYRTEQAEHINDVIEAFTTRHAKAYVFEAAQRAGVAAAPVNTPANLSADPFLRRRGYFRALHHPALDRTLDYPGPAVRLVGRDTGVRATSSTVGADNEAVWSGLGVSGTAIGMAVREGVAG